MERAFPWAYAGDAAEWRRPAADSRIVPLSQAKDFKLASGAPDLRGWNVFGADGERIGTVQQMLVDPAALQVRYLDVDVYPDLFLLKDDRHVLVPVERVDIKDRANDVWVTNLSAAEVARLPAYTGGAVTPAMERAVEERFTPSP
jgi:sporulation protein YlmC with PRC-barrel domain